MNNWGSEYMSNQFGISNMLPNVMPPLMPPVCISEMGTINPILGNNPTPLIGPILPDNLDSKQSADDNDVEIVENKEKHSKSNTQRDRDSKTDRRDRYYDRDRSRRRSRSRDRDRHRRDRSRDNKGSEDRYSHRSDKTSRRERQSKWNKPEDNHDVIAMDIPNMPIVPGMMAYNMIRQQPVDMVNMEGGLMPNPMPGVNIMMMNQQMLMANQSIGLSAGILLPPIPGTSMPIRREKPPGCRTIFVGGMPNGVTEELITEIFIRFGTICEVKVHLHGVSHVRFNSCESVEQSFAVSGYRFKFHQQLENEATTVFVDYALNRDDQNEYERNKQRGLVTLPPCVEPFTAAALASVTDKVKSEVDFIEVAPTVLSWLERGECNRNYANQFYCLIQATNNQVRRLFTDKMQLDEEFQTLKSNVKENYLKIITQFEQVANILTAAKHRRVSDHFTQQQRRNIDMWLKMTEEVENIKEEFDSYFEEDYREERTSNNVVPYEKYEELKKQTEDLAFELEGYKNEAHLAKDEAERKFEKFKAQFIAQQALMNPKQVYPPLPPLPSIVPTPTTSKPEPPPPTPDDMKLIKSGYTSQTDAKLISVMTAFLLIHPLGASLEYIASYVQSVLPKTSQETVSHVLNRYTELFRCKSTGIGPSIENKWEYITFDALKYR